MLCIEDLSAATIVSGGILYYQVEIHECDENLAESNRKYICQYILCCW